MIDLILILTLITCAVLAMLLKSQLRSAVALGASSALLAVIFFRLFLPFPAAVRFPADRHSVTEKEKLHVVLVDKRGEPRG